MHVVIVGNGVSGITAARTIRKLQSDWRISVISAETDHFFSRTALMYIYMGHMTYEDTKPYEDWFWSRNRINLIRAFVHTVDTDEKKLHLSDGQVVDYDKLILGVGSKYNTIGWPGQDLAGVQGLVSWPDLQLLEDNTENVTEAVVVGGGLIGIELTEMLHSRGLHVTFLVREKHYMSHIFPEEEGELIQRQIQKNDIDLRLETELKEILPGDDGRVGKVVTNTGETIECQFVGLTIGVRPNIDVVKNSNVEVDRGILVDRTFATSVEDVWAVGDCAEFRDPLPGRRPIEQLWYTGRIHGETVGMTVAGYPNEYDPGVFFNSAKFFDLEYQTYGQVAPEVADDEETLYWEHENGRHAIRINYRKEDGAVTGFNLMGVRYRQDVCSEWISSGTHIEDVLSELKKANFDPEFFERHEQEIRRLYKGHDSVAVA